MAESIQVSSSTSSILKVPFKYINPSTVSKRLNCKTVASTFFHSPLNELAKAGVKCWPIVVEVTPDPCLSLQPAPQHHPPKLSPSEKFFRVGGAALPVEGLDKTMNVNSMGI